MTCNLWEWGLTARSEEELGALEVAAAALGGVEALQRQVAGPGVAVHAVGPALNALHLRLCVHLQPVQQTGWPLQPLTRTVPCREGTQ